MYDEFDMLQHWLLSNKGPAFEGSTRASMQTVDGQGWHLEIDLSGTPLDGAAFEPVKERHTDAYWWTCWVDGQRFVADCGPQNLRQALGAFVEWFNPRKAR